MKSDLPKVLQPLAGKPLLAHVIDTARTLSPAAIHVVYGHGGERVRSALDATLASSAARHSWILQAEQLGTGHAVQQALPALADDELALILYGDVPLIRAETLRTLVAAATDTARGEAMGLLTVLLDDPTGYGRIVRDTEGRVRAIVEQKDASESERAIREGNTGVMTVPVQHLRRWLGNLRNANAQREYYLTDIIAMAVADGVRVAPLVAPTVAEVLGINDKIQLAEVEAEHRRLRARELMTAGVTLVDPARIDVRGTVEVGRDVEIDVNAVLEGQISLGDRVRIGPNCVLRNCRIADDVTINANCVLEDAEVGKGAIVGPFARLRPGAKLGAEVHIGNFVEVKNSSLGEGAKANHLAYVGDATVGARANIGAGTIIANYDGANKHHTTIGDDAHTGSNSVLVAPITVGAGATVGAGSTVTKDVAPGELAVARGRQVSIPGWKRPTKAPKK
ncbi:MAG: bifunctional UDP-N-acetylglucosamine diphosphorylase/glucosamine-1-phosphate N-acetyltransferase GlmU [Hyphomicrobiales bacterium]|nr:bifunctional UDP-N-acetylglucosamine diphosphorylase/glucosamine-1-phosphate N-acetyltransferase GlmU [Hyphomicrobiales bacterium]